jgi:hypothetical protein
MLLSTIMDDQPENRQVNRLVACGLYIIFLMCVMSADETQQINGTMVTTDRLGYANDN